MDLDTLSVNKFLGTRKTLVRYKSIAKMNSWRDQEEALRARAAFF